MREPFVQLGVRRIVTLIKNPLDIHEFAVAPHPDSHLPRKVELVLRRQRQTFQRVHRARVELARDGDDEKPAACPSRCNAKGKLKPVCPHGLEREPSLLLERFQLVPAQHRDLVQDLIGIRVGVIAVLRRDPAGKAVEHEREFARGRPAARARGPLELRIRLRRIVLQQVLADQRLFAHRGSGRVPVDQNVAAEAEVIEQLRGCDEVLADLEVVDVPQDVDEAAVPALLEPGRAERPRFCGDPVDDHAHEIVRFERRDRDTVSEMIHEGQSLVCLQQLARVLNLLDALFHDVGGDPFLDVARLRGDLLLALLQLDDEADLVDENDPRGQLHFLIGGARQLQCGKGERPQENIRVLLGGEILEETRRAGATLFHLPRAMRLIQSWMYADYLADRHDLPQD